MGDDDQLRGSTDDPGEHHLDYALVLAFDVDELAEGERDQFVRGFEAGGVYQIARLTDEAFDAPMHPQNAEMILRIAEATQRTVRSEELEGSEHVHVFFGPRQPE